MPGAGAYRGAPDPSRRARCGVRADHGASGLTLYDHPFAAFGQKVLVAVYELDLRFDVHLVEGDESRAVLADMWPIASMPVLRRRRGPRDAPRFDDDQRVPRIAIS